jgi:hypothetical protein
MMVTHMKEPIHRVKTVTRTFRLDENLHKMLEEEAAREKITVNSMLSRIIWNYQKRCQFCLHYYLMLMEPMVFKTMLDNLSDDALKQTGSSLGHRFQREPRITRNASEQKSRGNRSN